MAGVIGEAPLPPPNLFTPDFGQSPHVIVGRDALLRSAHDGLAAGPSDSRFTTLLLGPRGSGKTVVLNDIRGLAERSGWIVLPLDASTGGIGDRLSEYLEWVQDTHEGLPDLAGRGTQERSTATFTVPLFAWQREVLGRVRPRWSLRRQLSTLADHAARHDAAVLLAVDELHSGERSELRRLAADLQHIVKSEQRRLAFVGAGLSEMKHTLLEDKKMTFFQRCHREDMRPIDRSDAALFLRTTVDDAGGRFEGRALETLAEASGALPFQMQLVGHYAWRAAGAPLRPIGEDAAAVAGTEAKRAMHQRVAVPTWHGLSENEQMFLQALVECGGAAHPRQLAQMVPLNPKTLARTELHLSNACCVAVGADDIVRMGDVISTESVRLITDKESLYGGDATGHGARPRCNAVMPRAQARCVLPVGHAGGHRSR